MKSKEITLTHEETEVLRLAISVCIHRLKEVSEEYGGAFWDEQADLLRKILGKLRKGA